MVTDSAGGLGPVFRLLDRLVADDGLPGVAVAIGRHGRQIASYHSGEAAPGRPACSETLWPLASISKLYSAAAAMALVERGDLALTQPVHHFLPACRGKGRKKITVRHLITHTSGLVYESPKMEARLIAHTPLEDLIAEGLAHPLAFPPGSQFSYSDLGLAVLGKVASIAAGMPFPDLVRETVLEPAGLTATFFPLGPEHDHRLAAITDALAAGTDGAMYASRYALDLAHPAFGVVATVSDLLRFGLHFAPGGPRFLSAATVQAMTTDQTVPRGFAHPVRPQSGAPDPWGFGFDLKGTAGFPELASPGSFGHHGATGCTLWIDPGHDVTVAFVSNRHLLAGPDRFLPRFERVVNTTLACLTR